MRWLWAGIGFIFLAIGAIGIVVPLWPTTIFWILAVLCLAESHPKVRDWIYARPGIGRVIEDFVERGEISQRGKTAAIGGMLLACLISAWFLRQSITGLAAVIIGVLIGILFVATRPSPKA